MKTKPAKLLLALLFGFCTMAATAAYADDSKDSKDSKDTTSTPTPTGCTGKWVVACGITVFQTTCTSNVIPSTSKDKSGKDESDDEAHKSKEKDTDSKGKEGKNDRERFDESHRDHADRSNDPDDGKIAVCHRMGGAEVSLVVANDGWLSGHSKHALDTIGRCSDFDDDKSKDDSKEEKDKSDDEKSRERKSSASDVGYAKGLTIGQISCLKGPTTTSYTIGGTTYPGAGLNSPNTTFTFPSTGPSQGPSRGGARTLH